MSQTFFSMIHLCSAVKKPPKYNAAVELMRKATQ